jgi:hypothetical protein
MKPAAWIKSMGFTALISFGVSMVSAQTTNSDDLTVPGNLDVTNGIFFGSTTAPSNTSPAISFNYTDAVRTVAMTAAQSSSSFLWQDGGLGLTNSKMLLDGSNNLTLFGTNGSAGVVLNPNTGGIVLAGTNSGITFADGTVITSITNLQSSSLDDGSGNPLVSINADDTLLISTLSVAFGTGAKASGDSSAAFGGWNKASGDSSAAFGTSDTASGYASVVFGSWNTSSGNGAAAFGQGSVASGTFSAAFGWNTSASGWGAAAFGQQNTASGDGSVAFGQQNTASAFLSAAFGQQSTASGDFSTVFGQQTTAAGAASTAFGVLNQANSYCSVALGQNNVGLCQAGGQYAWIPSDPIIEIGNGTSGEPSNAVTIFKSGELRTEGAVQSKVGFRTPPTGDLSMGAYTAGSNPATLDPSLGLKYQGE